MAGLATRTNTSDRSTHNRGHKIALNHIVLYMHKQKLVLCLLLALQPSLQQLAGIASSPECRP